MSMARTVFSDLGDVHSFKHQLKNMYQVFDVFLRATTINKALKSLF